MIGITSITHTINVVFVNHCKTVSAIYNPKLDANNCVFIFKLNLLKLTFVILYIEKYAQH